MSVGKTVNVEKIQTYMKKNPRVEQVLRMLATRERGRQDTTFRRIMRLLSDSNIQGWSHADLKSLFEALQDAGAGRVVFGAKTPRFVWDFHLQSVARAALGMPEPTRKRKDGTKIEEPGFRRPTPPRHALPKLARVPSQETVQPVDIAAPVSPDAEPVVIKKNGVELCFDLSKVSDATAKRLAHLLGL